MTDTPAGDPPEAREDERCWVVDKPVRHRFGRRDTHIECHLIGPDVKQDEMLVPASRATDPFHDKPASPARGDWYEQACGRPVPPDPPEAREDERDAGEDLSDLARLLPEGSQALALCNRALAKLDADASRATEAERERDEHRKRADALHVQVMQARAALSTLGRRTENPDHD